MESSGIFIHGRLSQSRVDHPAFIPDDTVLATGVKADTSSPTVAISTSAPSTSNPASASSSSNSASNRGSANPQLNPIISNGQQGDEVARLRKRFLRKMKSSVDFLAETLSGTSPDSGQVATADLIETLEEVSDELSERLADTKRLLDQLRGEQM
jgi:ABC-type transporter Mla subunit MlaD